MKKSPEPSKPGYEQFLTDLKKLKFEEKRKDTADYLEFVFLTASSGKLTPVLEKFYGPAAKPHGKMPDRNAMQHSAPWGGVRPDQTLYFRSEESFSYVGLLWPWSDGMRVTVKIARTKAKK